MSKRGPRPTVPAYRRSGFVRPPPIGQAAAEAAYGGPLPDPAWRRIVAAFDVFGQMLDVLAGPRLGAYADGRDRAERALVAAFEAVVRLQGDAALLATMRFAALDAAAGEWLPDGEAALVAAMQRALGADAPPPGPVGLGATLNVAANALRHAAGLVAAAGRPAVATFSEADARRWLAREIVAGLAAVGLDTRLTGWHEREDMADCDLTPVERLLAALQVPPSDNPRTAARWIRDATAG